jgi:peroxiredoxin
MERLRETWKANKSTILAGVFAVVLVSTVVYWPAPTHPLVGKPAPNFHAVQQDGTPFDAASVIGKQPVVFFFWSLHCEPCRAEMPALNALWKTYRDQGVAFFGIDAMDAPGPLSQYLKQENVGLPVLMDANQEGFVRYNVPGTPQTVFVGKDGIIKDIQVGFGYERELKRRFKHAFGL